MVDLAVKKLFLKACFDFSQNLAPTNGKLSAIQYLFLSKIAFCLHNVCALTFQVKVVKNYITPERFWSSLHHVDYKFLSIPVVFVFLRIWTTILSVLYDYIQLDVARVPNSVNLALIYLSVSLYYLTFIVEPHLYIM